MRSFKPYIFLILFLALANKASSQIVAPDFSVYTTHQDSFHLYDDYLDSGKVVMIEFFFTTCPPCAQISPYMEDLYQDWGGGDGDVEFILITTQSFDDNSDVADYAAQYGFTFPGVGVDGGAIGVWNTYKDSPWGSIFGTPAFIVISPDGSVQYDVSGPGVDATLDSLNAALERAVNPTPQTVKYFNDILSTHYATGDTIYNVKGSFINYPDDGDTSIALPVDSGRYTEFLPDSLPNTATFDLVLSKEDSGALLRGVSTFDIFLIQRTILDLHEMTVYERFAGDINDDGTLSGSDIIALRRLILGITNELPGGRDAWRFFPDYQPDDPLDSIQYDHIWEFPQEWQYASEEESGGHLSFQAVKIGDVNASWTPLSNSPLAEQRSASKVLLRAERSADGKRFDFFPEDNREILYSFQLDLHISRPGIYDIRSPFPDDQLLARQIGPQTLRIGYYAIEESHYSSEQPLFSIHGLEEKDPTQLTVKASEWYSELDQAREIEVVLIDREGFPVWPNPANSQVFFYSSKQGTLFITDLSGRQILSELKFNKGINSLDISAYPSGTYFLYDKENSLKGRFMKP